jgi:protein-tyrosine-phosphatase
MPEQLRVLFVCTGNICRSPMAEGVAWSIVESEHPKGWSSPLSFASAGTAGLTGEPPTREAMLAMESMGIDISSHRARKLSHEVLDKSDLILVMEKRQGRLVEEMCDLPAFLFLKLAEAARKSRLTLYDHEELLAFARQLEEAGDWDLPSYAYEVPDPIGMPLAEYAAVASVVINGVRPLLLH